jgi:biotin carboxyl carrier protein
MSYNIKQIVTKFAQSKAKYLKVRMGEKEVLEIKKPLFHSKASSSSKGLSQPHQDPRVEGVISENVGYFTFDKAKIIKGAAVTPKLVLGSVEAMGIKHNIFAPFNGVIKEVLVKEEDVVEYGQVLFLVRETL